MDNFRILEAKLLKELEDKHKEIEDGFAQEMIYATSNIDIIIFDKFLPNSLLESHILDGYAIVQRYERKFTNWYASIPDKYRELYKPTNKLDMKYIFDQYMLFKNIAIETL